MSEQDGATTTVAHTPSPIPGILGTTRLLGPRPYPSIPVQDPPTERAHANAGDMGQHVRAWAGEAGVSKHGRVGGARGVVCGGPGGGTHCRLSCVLIPPGGCRDLNTYRYVDSELL